MFKALVGIIGAKLATDFSEGMEKRWLNAQRSLRKTGLLIALINVAKSFFTAGVLMLLGSMFLSLADLPFAMPLLWTGIASLGFSLILVPIGMSLMKDSV